MYLKPAKCDAGINNILMMARDRLHPELTIVLRRAVETAGMTRKSGQRVKTNDDFTRVNLTVRPVIKEAAPTHAQCLYLVIPEPAPAPTEADIAIGKLKQELQLKEDNIQAFHEELVASNEVLKCSNEEMQSVNEELSTVNTGLQAKLLDLSQADNEMNNLLAGTGIATLYLDRR